MTPNDRAHHVDAHAHLDKYTDDELPGLLTEIAGARILTICVADEPAAYVRTRDLAGGSPWVIPTFGIHPWEAPRFVGSIDRFVAEVEATPMIGEIGLDHRFVTDPAAHRAQAVVFAAFLDHAVTERKSVNVHSCGAEREVAAMLREHRVERAILHWYSGPLDVLGQLVGDGHFVTVGVELLRSEHIRQIAAAIPPDQLLTETDNPGGQRWLTGRAGRPRLVEAVEAALAEIHGTSTAAVRDLVRANLRRLFEEDRRLSPWAPLLAATG